MVSLNESQYNAQIVRANPIKTTGDKYYRFLLERELQDTAVNKAANQGKQDGVKSGAPIKPMYIGLIDKYGNIVGTATNSKLTI